MPKNGLPVESAEVLLRKPSYPIGGSGLSVVHKIGQLRVRRARRGKGLNHFIFQHDQWIVLTGSLMKTDRRRSYMAINEILSRSLSSENVNIRQNSGGAERCCTVYPALP